MKLVNDATLGVLVEDVATAGVEGNLDVVAGTGGGTGRNTGDEVGGVEANKRVSLQRAETVKRVLGQSGISADRIEAVGGGINYDAPNRKEARNATTFEIIK